MLRFSFVTPFLHVTAVSVQSEIEDRQKFLADMEALGQGDKYRQIIATEISQVSCAPSSFADCWSILVHSLVDFCNLILLTYETR